MRWETEWPFHGQLCQKYVYQNILKLDNPSSSYGKKKLVCFLCLTVYLCVQTLNEKSKQLSEEKASLSDQGLLTSPFIGKINSHF